jgi:asparagine synthase (glutamine-hydrolysing)
MCGIAGFVGNGTKDDLEKLIAGVKHRGPDDEGTLIRHGVGLAHARLAIIDTSPLGHQPMELSDESVAITYNGEIYNYEELRNGLQNQGVKFRSHSDTEVLLELYRREGEDFLKRAVGMFALGLYDFRNKKLILARDRMGEKPLYWTMQNGSLYFASELSALMKAGVALKRIDMLSLSQYLTFDYVPTPRTILEDVYKLEPAHILILQGGQIAKKSYWKLPPGEVALPLEEATKELDIRLKRAAKRQLVSDVPVGILLSGGIDSSTVAYYAKESAEKNIETFSVSFEEKSFDESMFAKAVASHLGSNHHEERLSGKDALDLLPAVADVFSEPVADASVLPTMLLSRFTRKSVTVALGGDGGDELFAGYPTFQAERIFSHISPLMRRTLRTFAALFPASHSNFAFSYNLKKLVSEGEPQRGRRHAKWLGTFSETARGRLLKTEMTENDLFAHIDRYEKERPGLNGLLWIYARTYLLDQVLVKVDRASMHYALETRAPFLDHEVVEFLFGLPYEMKWHNGIAKYLLKETMRGKLPRHIIDRKKKGFGIPLARWLNHELRPLCDELLSPAALSQHGLFDQNYVARLIQEHRLRKKDNRKELWNLMVFQLWYDRWMTTR